MNGARLKEFRLKRDLAQERIAEKMYVVQQTFSHPLAISGHI